MRGLIVAGLTLLLAGQGADCAIAKARLAAGGATVEFPVGTPERGTGTPDSRHGDSSIRLFAATFDHDQGSPAELEELGTALKSLEAWHVFARESQQSFLFVTMPFPDRLARSLWAERCRPPPEQQGIICRAVDVGGAPGREYLFWAKDPLRPGVRPYLVQRIVVRKDRLYLLAYGGEQDEALPVSDHPSAPEQKMFLGSLRFGDP